MKPPAAWWTAARRAQASARAKAWHQWQRDNDPHWRARAEADGMGWAYTALPHRRHGRSVEVRYLGDAGMPSKSGKQHRAMEAAAHGKSNLGIPKSVGKEFVKADKGKSFSKKSGKSKK